jgi:chemotaxis protein histidine kinase CheA
MKTFKDLLIELQACEDAKEWAGEKNIEEIVKDCHRGDWLLWLAKNVDIPLRPITLAKARCAKTVIHLMEDQRSIDAVNIAEQFGLTDEVSEDDLRKAAAAANSAAAYYSANSAAAAAYSAAAAANSAYSAAAADNSAAAAAYYSANSANSAAAAAAKTKNQQQTSDICREVLGKMIIERVNELLK